jgi:hypothetical protein
MQINIIYILIGENFKTLNKLLKLLGIGDWGLGIGPNPQSPIPNIQYHDIFNLTTLNLNNNTIIFFKTNFLKK